MFMIVSLYVISRGKNDPKQYNGKEPYFAANLDAFDPKSGHQFFFFKNLASSVTRHHGQLSSCIL